MNKQPVKTTENCQHAYSKAMNQEYPRKCVKCGMPEKQFEAVEEKPEAVPDFEDAAEEFADSKERRLTSYWKGLKDGYISGSTTERNRIKEFDKNVVQPVINQLQEENARLKASESYLLKEVAEKNRYIIGLEAEIKELKVIISGKTFSE